MADHQALADLGQVPVAEFDDLGEIVAGVHVQQCKGQAAAEAVARSARLEGLLGQAQQHARILAGGKQQRGALETRRHLAQDEDGFFFQPVEVALVECGQQLVDAQRRVHAGIPGDASFIAVSVRPWGFPSAAPA
jgi:hypothetical protein